MKLIMTLTMILMFNQAFSQAEPDAFNKKDLIEKLDRTDLETDTDETLKNSIPKFEIPLMELDIPVKAAKKPVKKRVGTGRNNTKTPKPKAGSKNLVKKSKPKIVIAKRPILISQIKKNDKIVIANGKTSIYRQLKNSVIKYKFKGIIPVKSEALKPIGSNGYYVIDPKKLAGDIRALKSNSKSKSERVTVKKPNKVATKATTKPAKLLVKKPTVKPVKKAEQTVEQSISAEVAEKRKQIESKYNRGKVIKKSIKLKNLHVNDEIYIVGDTQFIIRSRTGSPGKKKYWLTEKVDINNKALEKMGKNKYRVLRFYKGN